MPRKATAHRNSREATEQIAVRLPCKLLEKLGEIALAEGISRSDVLRMLLKRGLRAGSFAESGVPAA